MTKQVEAQVLFIVFYYGQSADIRRREDIKKY